MCCGLGNKEFKKDREKYKIGKKNSRAFLLPMVLYSLLPKQLDQGVFELHLNPIVVFNSFFSQKEIGHFSGSK